MLYKDLVCSWKAVI